MKNYTLEQLKIFWILFLEIFIKSFHKPELNQLLLCFFWCDFFLCNNKSDIGKFARKFGISVSIWEKNRGQFALGKPLIFVGFFLLFLFVQELISFFFFFFFFATCLLYVMGAVLVLLLVWKKNYFSFKSHLCKWRVNSHLDSCMYFPNFRLKCLSLHN